ncbi:hypothetical protein L3Y34_004593 [Caenorhabditis briggsae]|uniref:Protein CBR-PRMT-3 n=2 Tax=Caenorhabditis briggsae TaxID=6238 RepID=A0AAE9AC20_CAEBR|nr:hypothetical protein L3Y34_004593 [Caenorhabditis briggsae]
MSGTSGEQGQFFSMEIANKALVDGNFEEALKHFFVCIKMLPVERRGRYEDQFAAAIHGWITQSSEHAARAVNLYPQIRDLFPETVRTKIAIVKAVQISGQGKWLLNCLPIVKEAMALTTNPEDRAILRIARVNLTTVPFPQWHIRMVNDTMRNEFFLQALTASIKSKSSVVFDIGSGTGLLSVMAARMSNLVIALEEDVCLAMISKEVLKRNKVADRVTVHAKNSMQFETSQNADVIVSETMDCCCFGERIIETFLDAHVRFAHENTIFIPQKATVYVRLFQCREIFDIHCQDYSGIRYRSEYVKINDEPTEQPYWCAAREDYAEFEFLSPPEELHTADFSRLDVLQKSLRCEGSTKLKPKKKGVAHGFTIHFVADLTGTGVLVDSGDCHAWDYGVVPFKEPCVVDVGQELDVSWKLVNNRLDVYNNFYSEKLQKAGSLIQYQTISMDRLHKIRDDSYFKQMMAEITINELPFTEDISFCVPAECVLKTYPNKEPTGTIIAGFIRHDGSLNQDNMFRIEQCVGHRDFVKKIVPSQVRIYGHLFYSDYIHFDARPDPTAHCKVDLATVRNFNLREMRDIRLTQRNDIVLASEEFEMIFFDNDPNNYRNDLYETVTKEITVQPNLGAADGVLYEFEVLGVRNSKLRPVAAFLFQDRIRTGDQPITLNFDYHLGEMLISLKED